MDERRENSSVEGSDGNVISLFGQGGRKAVSGSKGKNDEDDQAELSFTEIMKKNAQNKKRMQDDRKRANRSVIRSYRLKK